MGQGVWTVKKQSDVVLQSNPIVDLRNMPLGRWAGR